MIYVFVVTALLSWTDALAGAKTYGATKPYTYDQQIRRGEREQVKMTVARRVYMGHIGCLLYTSPSPRDATLSRMPSSA